MNEELYCGVDLHSNNGVYHVMDAGGQQVWHRRLPNDREAVLRSLAPFRDDLVSVAVESTYNWYWLADCLEDHGYAVELAHASGMSPYSGLKNANDDSDAWFIADLRRMGRLPTGWICPREVRALRDLLRRRQMFVKNRSGLITSIRSLLARETGSGSGYNTLESLTTEELTAMVHHRSQTVVVHAQLAAIASLDAAIASLEDHALAQCRPRLEYKLLTTVPGIGKILSMTIMLELGSIERFPTAGRFSSYSRSVKAEKISNGKRKGANNRRNGNKYLGWAFIEAVQHAQRCCKPARSWYQRKAAATHPVVARKALASKFTKAVWYMLTQDTPFQPQRIFG